MTYRNHAIVMAWMYGPIISWIVYQNVMYVGSGIEKVEIKFATTIVEFQLGTKKAVWYELEFVKSVFAISFFIIVSFAIMGMTLFAWTRNSLKSMVVIMGFYCTNNN